MRVISISSIETNSNNGGSFLVQIIEKGEGVTIMNNGIDYENLIELFEFLGRLAETKLVQPVAAGH